PGGLGGQGQYLESKDQSRHVASCSLALGPVKSLKVLNQIRITKIRWDTLDDASRFHIQNVPCTGACSSSRLLSDEADRVGLELQPILSLRSIDQLWIGEEAASGEDLVVVADEGVAGSEGELALCQGLHDFSHRRGPFVYQPADPVDCGWSRNLVDLSV